MFYIDGRVQFNIRFDVNIHRIDNFEPNFFVWNINKNKIEHQISTLLPGTIKTIFRSISNYRIETTSLQAIKDCQSEEKKNLVPNVRTVFFVTVLLATRNNKPRLAAFKQKFKILFNKNTENRNRNKLNDMWKATVSLPLCFVFIDHIRALALNRPKTNTNACSSSGLKFLF